MHETSEIDRYMWLEARYGLKSSVMGRKLFMSFKFSLDYENLLSAPYLSQNRVLIKDLLYPLLIMKPSSSCQKWSTRPCSRSHLVSRHQEAYWVRR
jgi:hypothetical protein